MSLVSCTFFSSQQSIGWSNVARAAQFRDWIQYRMDAGFTYLLTAPPIGCTVIYNNALKIDHGVTMHNIYMILREMEEDFLHSGDISIVRLSGAGVGRRQMAVVPQEVLDNHTWEMPPQLVQ